MPYKDKDKARTYCRNYYSTHKEERKITDSAYYSTHKEEYNTRKRIDTNSFGKTKNSVRARSSRYLFNKLKHSKLKGYEIHHCFGYEDYKCFIYIPKELHLQIHRYLRDNKISAESNHYTKIAHLINVWDGYTYIKV